MAYGKLKVDTITYDNGGTEVDVQVSALAGAGSVAPLNSPNFTGTPTAPTPTTGSNDTSIATTQFVTDYGQSIYTAAQTYTDAEIIADKAWIQKDQNQGGQELTSNTKILTDTSGSAFSLVLPATPQQGDEIVLADKNGTWNTNNLTIEINANYGAEPILGASNDLVCNVQYAVVRLIYTGNATVGWIVK